MLLYLCRSWYSKASKDQSYSAMKTALRYAQLVSHFSYHAAFERADHVPLQALHLHPHDKVILYNIAMIEQKAAEMLMRSP